jgi:septum formation protein
VRCEGEAPWAYTARLAREKGVDVARALTRDTFVLGADTVVVVDGDVLEKPRSDPEGVSMLRRLSGRDHEVLTAVALVRAPGDVVGERLVSTTVRFRALDDAEIAAYVASGEGRDKAGGYAIQGLAAGFIPFIHGCYHNVVGLPVADTLELLRAHGVIGDWP